MPFITKLILLLTLSLTCLQVQANKHLPVPGADTVPALKYPLTDTRGDAFSSNSRPGIGLNRPPNITDSIIYDPKTKQYYIIERVGRYYYRKPTSLTTAEFMKIMATKQEQAYFQQRSKVLSNLNYGLQKPKLSWNKNLVNRLFGTGPDGLPKVEIKPQGEVNILGGYQGQRIQNPTLPERAQKNGGFDFNMNYRFNVNAKIGEFLNFPISQNSLANFDFENVLKLDYQGQGDGIIKQFQAGNISFPSRGTLIPGASNVFGLKSVMQFGKAYVTVGVADQRNNRATQQLQGGAAAQRFEVRADEYEENRHFLIAKYFKNNYNKALKTMPIVNSPVLVRRVEVWVTNRNGATTEARDIVGLMDLAETQSFVNYPGGVGGLYPQNNANGLYSQVTSLQNVRSPATVTSKLNSLGLQPVQDYEKVFARKLRPDEYYFNPKLGFLSLNQPLRDDEVMGVALEYTVNGKVFKIGEFSQDIPPDTTNGVSKILFLKLLKATSARTNLPIWDLMMKNVYAVGFGYLQKPDFRLDVLYAEPSTGEKNYIPDVDVAQQKPLLTLLNLDNLNNQGDPQPDGRFDYVDSITVIPQYSRIIFPVLEPFGHDLDYVFTGTDSTFKRNKYLYYPLYDTIKAIAQLYPNLNRYIIKGYSKSTGGSEYNIGFNIPRGSVVVTAGGQILRENIDYSIDYDAGNLKILNTAILNTGIPVNINFESNGAGFTGQQKNYLYARLDYQWNKKLALGSTMVRLTERPFFRKMQFGEDPVKNTMIGGDFTYQTQSKKLTRLIDKLPNITTTAPSNIAASGEVAAIIPGNPPQIGKGSESRSFLDDFEGARSSYDLKFPVNGWVLASTPYSATDVGGALLLPGSNTINDLAYGYGRAKLSWYQIEQNLQDRRATSNPMRAMPGFLDSISDMRVRQATANELFPNRTVGFGENLLPTFDLAFNPNERGPYNYDATTTNVNANGSLKLPNRKWGGIMRSIDQPDFETANFEFLEFWIQDPFNGNPSATGGQMYLNLGNVSEDVLRDGRRMYENGLNTPTLPATTDTTRWSRVPINPIQVTSAFSNTPADRPFQDVGLDGMNDVQEDSARVNYLTTLRNNFGASSLAFINAKADPSNDNYKWYRNQEYTTQNAGILTRYKNINNQQGNSPTSSSSTEFSEAWTLQPDAEELNRDNTLNETEEYFQYKIDLRPNMQIGQTEYLVDKRTVNVKLPNEQTKSVNWYLFRVPMKEYYRKVGNIPDFKSIRFMRMFLTNFNQPVVVRFARLELVRNQWRQFSNELRSDGIYTPLQANNTKTTTGSVSIEENDRRTPVNYVSPCDVVREQIINNNFNQLENEQAMSLVFRNLQSKDSRAVFKTINYDINQYKKLAMYIHAESGPPPTTVIDNDSLVAVVRIGNDFINNFYEVRIPLKITPPKGTYLQGECKAVWPDANKLDFDLDILRNLKISRNTSGSPLGNIYSQQVGNRTFSIMGNPSLGEIRGILLGVYNPIDDAAYDGEVWFNELRLIGLNQKGGYAANVRVNINLADFGTINLAGSMHTIGFGNLEQRVNERYRDNFVQVDANTNLELGKLLPKKWGMQIPVNASYSNKTSSPLYDAYDKDLNLKEKLKTLPSNQRDSVRNTAIDQVVIKSLTINNLKKNKTNGKKAKIYDISNLDASYGVVKTETKNPLVEQDDVTKHTAALSYTYSPTAKYWEPLKNVKGKLFKSKWFSIIKDFNLNPVPSLLSFRADVNRQFGVFRPRNVGIKGYSVPETYNKYFTFDRRYDMRWDITKALNIDYTALNNARVDEPNGLLNTSPKRDTLQNNFLRGGRNTLFNQRISANYTLPISKIPLLDFTRIDLKYQVTYDWIGASRLAVDLGNIIKNNNQKGITGELDFTKLYNKIKFFQKLDQPRKQPPTDNQSKIANAKLKDVSTLKGKQLKQANRYNTKLLAKINRPVKIPKAVPGIAYGAGKLITALKRVNINFTENGGTTLPGYMDSTKQIGNNFKSMAPGTAFVFGAQPDTSFLNKISRRNLLTSNPIFNDLFRQDINQRFEITAQIEPIRDFTIDLNISKTFNKNYSELFKDTNPTFANNYKHLGGFAQGSFQISYFAGKTAFAKFNGNEPSSLFNTFQEIRKVLSTRMGKLYPNYAQLGISNPVGTDGYYYGYSRYATDVLIPSFVAAYTGQDANKISLLKQGNENIRSNPFNGFLPKPNWGFTYRGLSNIPALQKIFTNISIAHKYSSTLGMNSFNSALLFADTFGLNFPTFYDTTYKNFVPYFYVPNLTLSESFEPLLSIDMQFTNRLNINLDYRIKRDISLSLIDYQVSEIRSKQYGLRMDWVKQGKPGSLKKVKIFGKNFDLNNDIRFECVYSYRDDVTSNTRLDQVSSFPTNGQEVLHFAPSVDYTLNKRVNLKLYYDRTRIIPKLPSASPITTTRAGLEVRISLTE